MLYSEDVLNFAGQLDLRRAMSPSDLMRPTTARNQYYFPRQLCD